MSLNLNSQNNPQLLQQRLNVREQEINALKVQNRHLLSKMEELENQAKPNQINTKFIADDMHTHLAPVIEQMHSTMNASFEMLQSTMRGIYQQSQRAQQAVEDMAAQSKDLENRMNDQRKADQVYYQDRIFAMIGAFCDRIERQIDVRLKALSVIEFMNAKQNEVLNDVESMKGTLALMQKNFELGRGETNRFERSVTETNQKLNDMQIQAENGSTLIRDLMQQVHTQRAEFKLIRAEIKNSLNEINRAPFQDLSEVDENQIINDLIDKKHRELESLERNLEAQNLVENNGDATSMLALLRAQKLELQRVAGETKTYLKQQREQNALYNENNENEPTQLEAMNLNENSDSTNPA